MHPPSPTVRLRFCFPLFIFLPSFLPSFLSSSPPSLLVLRRRRSGLYRFAQRFAISGRPRSGSIRPGSRARTDRRPPDRAECDEIITNPTQLAPHPTLREYWPSPCYVVSYRVAIPVAKGVNPRGHQVDDAARSEPIAGDSEADRFESEGETD